MTTSPEIRRDVPVRVVREEDLAKAKPIYVVWEITMKCDQPCQHCGSRAGKARPDELTTDEILEVADGLVRLGTREVTLIGGEAYLRDDCLTILRALVARDIRVSMQTGGRSFSRERARQFREAGLASLGVSIDGLEKSHDKLRGNVGSFAATMTALDNARAEGLVTSVNTQINRLNAPDLAPLGDVLRERGVMVWQNQLTGPLGRAADIADWLLQPWMVVAVMDTLADIQKRHMQTWDGKGVPFNVLANNNLGYFGPHEQTLRSRPLGDDVHWTGCPAGIYTMGIESDGVVKACPTLPTAPYNGGNVRSMSIEDLWERSEIIRFARDRTLDELWGHCKTCYYADRCRGGCAWTAHTTLGRRGNNPFCYHRVKQLEKKGLRERLVQVEQAPNLPYDFGRFEIVEEPWPQGEKAGDPIGPADPTELADVRPKWKKRLPTIT